MLITLIDFASPAFDELVNLRYELLREPLSIDFSVKEMESEFDHFHIAIYNDSFELLGGLVLEPQSETKIQLRQLVVDTGFQRQKVGSQLVHFSEVFAKEKGFQELFLHARENVIPFYEKLNYEEVGDPFIEVNIPHVRMKKSL